MKRFILSLLAVAIILVIAISCSKDQANDVLPTVGNANLNGKKIELTYSLLGKMNLTTPPWGVDNTHYAFMLAREMDAYGNLTKEPYLLGYISALPEAGSQLTFNLNDNDLSFSCILNNKEYRQHPTNKTLPITSGTFKLQRSTDDVFYIDFDIRTSDGNTLSGTAQLNYIP